MLKAAQQWRRAIRVLLPAIAIVLVLRMPQVLESWRVNRAATALHQVLVSQETTLPQPRPISDLDKQVLLTELQARLIRCDTATVSYVMQANFAQGQYPAAAAFAQQRLQSCPNDAMGWYWLGEVFRYEERWSETAAAWQRAGAVAALRKRGDQLAQEGKWSDALPIYLAVVSLEPEDCIYRVRAGNALWWGTQDQANAMKHFQSAIEYCPSKLEAYVAAGRVQIEVKDYAAAELWAMRARRVDPTSELPLSVLALARLRQNDPDGAIPYVQEALVLNSRSAEAHALLSLTYLNMMQLEQAVQEMSKAIDLGPTLSWQFVTLGIAYEKLGERAEAIAAFQRALEMNPTEKHARERLDQLQKAE